MAKHHRDRSWAPAPEPLNEWTIDNHTHVRSVVPFSKAMSHEAEVKGQPYVPVYSEGELLDMAAAVGVRQIVDVGCEYPNLARAVSLAEEFPDRVHAALAIHPNEAVLHGHRGAKGPDGLEIKYKPWHDISFDDALAEVHRLAVAYPDIVVAIGETGLDFFRTGDAARDYQREAFRAHIALAKELDLPMQIHDRDAHADCIDILLKDGAPDRTVFHSYSGDAEMGRIARDNGWYLSFSGTVSYKGNEGIRESLALIPRDHILVETDAPYLTSMPYRGRTNAPYMIPYTLAAMADVLDLTVDETAALTRENARRVYGI
ncbi:TatD family hydrolase [Bifidobacterium vansinderenii]|uniref:Hydrolase TatD n=1 Tax=Bifidobacterium vansinderenii TaxID=1984871 RepID=A0A229VYH3_9BIFI|nr:TatD family hydrolase [Bifidobacterium vansinderenii]OXN00674.1 hydrolase TatD [Bifidobacterium vansinderenii]